MKILSAAQMRNIDRRATEKFGIPSIVLMENAAVAVVRELIEHYPDAERASIFCGGGQNGGDGFAVARHLENHGIAPTIFLLGDPKKLSAESRTNYSSCLQLGLPVKQIETDEAVDEALAAASQSDVIVDAIFGTGLNRPAEGLQAAAIEGITDLRLPIVAVDIPSGLDASSASVNGPAIRADLTVTFAQPKIAHIFYPASEYCGLVVVADISIPSAAVDVEPATIELLTASGMGRLFPPRAKDSHKGTYGHLVVVAGSEGRSGAAALATRAALRGGAGLVTVATDFITTSVVLSHSPEAMSHRSEHNLQGAEALARFISERSAAVVGPGLADAEPSYEFVRSLMQRIDRPCVIDASAINAFRDRISGLKHQGAERILTPHPGELSRLLGIPTAAIQGDRMESARRAAALSGCVVLLKGHQSIIADPDGRIAVNPTGNPGLATGGTGDVLSGLLGALLARGLDAFEAACAGAFIHGSAADRIAADRSEIGIRAMEIADRIPETIEQIRKDALGGSRP